MGEKRRGDVPAGDTFVRALESLKATGGTVLLVGDDAASAHEGLCRRLLGTPSDDRYRVFVSADADSRPHVESMVAAEGAVRSIDYARLRENAPDDPLGALSLALIRAIDELELEADGFGSGALRVCLDSARPLLGVHNTEQVFRALHATTARIKHAGGIGHVHLPVEPDNQAASVLAPLFDATVEFRAADDGYEHRWRLQDADAVSGWLPVED